MQKLARLGFEPREDEIMTSGDVTYEFLKRKRAGQSVYLVATERGYVGSMLEDPIEDTRQDW